MAGVEPRLERVSAERFRVIGPLTFATVTRLLGPSLGLLGEADALDIDLGAVPRSDSAGLALLIEWMRHARRRDQPIRFLNMPPQMLAIARASSLDQVLPLVREPLLRAVESPSLN